LVALEDRAVPTASHFSEYAVPTPASGPDYMTLGSDGNVWFSEYGAVNATGGGKIGRITPDGQITEFDTTYPYVGAIVAGPDGNLWFTENNDLTTFGGPPAPFLGIYERVAREEAVLLWGW
jgi:streptogramin lyase